MITVNMPSHVNHKLSQVYSKQYLHHIICKHIVYSKLLLLTSIYNLHTKLSVFYFCTTIVLHATMLAKTVALMFPPSLQQVITDAEWLRLQMSLFVVQMVSIVRSRLRFPITAAALNSLKLY